MPKLNTMPVGRTVGENALERTLRLLGKLREKLCDPEVPAMMELKLELYDPGSGAVVNYAGEALFRFRTLSELEEFLEAPLAGQVRLIRHGGFSV